MAGHAGFILSMAIKEEALQTLIRILYHNDALPVSADGLFLDLPKITCAAADNDRITFNLCVWGEKPIDINGEVISVVVRLQLRVLVPPMFSVQGSSLSLRLDGQHAEFADIKTEVLSGGVFSAWVKAYIDSATFQAQLKAGIIATLSSIDALIPSFGLTFLSGSATKVTPHIVDGALLIGIDIISPSGSGLTTQGDYSSLVDTSANHQIGIWINPAALPHMLPDIQTQAVDAVQVIGGAWKAGPSLSVQEGSINFEGRIQFNSPVGSMGEVHFLLKMRPHLGNGYSQIMMGHGHHVGQYVQRHDLWFELFSVRVDAEPSWWIDCLQVLSDIYTLGLGPHIVDNFVDIIRDNVNKNAPRDLSVSQLTQTFTFAGTAEPEITMEMKNFECHAEGFFAAFRLEADFPGAGLDGSRSEYVRAVRPGSRLRYSVRPPFDMRPDDPLLRIRWTVRQVDQNVVVFTQDGLVRDNGFWLEFTTTPAFVQAPSFDIECRIYRAAGSEINDIYNGRIRLDIYDVLEHDHKYVRWRHQVYKRIERTERDGSRTLLGLELRWRNSAIHKTDFATRCIMAERFSTKIAVVYQMDKNGGIVKVPITDSERRVEDLDIKWESDKKRLEYLDALPYSSERELIEHRDILCDYCFFGGPTKKGLIL